MALALQATWRSALLLGRIGYSRDGKKGKLQIVYGLLCNAEGCPVAVEVYEGNTPDPVTLADQIHKVRKRFGLEWVVFVGDRDVLASARIDEQLRPVEGRDMGITVPISGWVEV